MPPPSTDQPLGSNNPFRRKLGNSNPSSPSPSPVTISTGPIDYAKGSRFSFDSPRDSTLRGVPPATTFRSAAVEEKGNQRDDEPVQPKPKKIVKKVRVQSPPPSSPEDIVPVKSYPPDDYDDGYSTDSKDGDDHVDPFNSEPSEPLGSLDEPPLPRPPPNPFSKTLQDLEHSTRGQKTHAAAGAKGSLDVNSFKRLLLTGYANLPATPAFGTEAQPQAPTHDGASNTDASSVSRQSIFDAIQETPRTSHEISEPEEPDERRSILPASPLSTIHSTSGRKPPPPPSSRHGKLIKIELGADPRPSTSTASKESSPRMSIDTSGFLPGTSQRVSSGYSFTQVTTPSPTTSDINKPLPRPPSLSAADEEVDSPFDREAAGKLPESFAELTTNTQPPTPPPGLRSRSESQASIRTTSSLRRPAAPPPRRQGRVEGRVSSSVASPAVPGDEDVPRSSLESTRSRAESFRLTTTTNLAAPAPPPPRRPNHARQGSSFTSPREGSFTSLSSPSASDDARSPALGVVGHHLMDKQSLNSIATVTTSRDGVPKLSPPPPPPARHSSTRRPPSVHSIEVGGIGVASPRKASREKDGMAPPPPPPRARGSSKSSMTSLEIGRRASGEVGRVEEEPVEIGAGADILKDLEALQREVDAARGVIT